MATTARMPIRIGASTPHLSLWTGELHGDEFIEISADTFEQCAHSHCVEHHTHFAPTGVHLVPVYQFTRTLYYSLVCVCRCDFSYLLCLEICSRHAETFSVGVRCFLTSNTMRPCYLQFVPSLYPCFFPRNYGNVRANLTLFHSLFKFVSAEKQLKAFACHG